MSEQFKDDSEIEGIILRLQELAKNENGEYEREHIEADNLLLRVIQKLADPPLAKIILDAYLKIEKWYS